MKKRLSVFFAFILFVLPLVFAEDQTLEADTTKWNIGQVMWHQENFHNTPMIFAKKVQVIDPDMNQDQTKIEKFSIDVWSDSDPNGIIVSVYETGKNTGIFGSIIYFSELSSSGQRIHTDIGDSITARYDDATLPSSSSSETSKLQITDTIIINSFPGETDSNFRVDDPAFFRQSLQTGETISNTFLVQIIEGLGASLIILFILIYAIKKRKKK